MCLIGKSKKFHEMFGYNKFRSVISRLGSHALIFKNFFQGPKIIWSAYYKVAYSAYHFFLLRPTNWPPYLNFSFLTTYKICCCCSSPHFLVLDLASSLNLQNTPSIHSQWSSRRILTLVSKYEYNTEFLNFNYFHIPLQILFQYPVSFPCFFSSSFPHFSPFCLI